MNDMVDRYGKDVVVVETAYAFTNEQGDAHWTIRDVEVKDGKATIGIDMVGNAGNWGSIDDVEFYLQE